MSDQFALLRSAFERCNQKCERHEREQVPRLIASHFDSLDLCMSLSDVADVIRARGALPEQTYADSFSLASFTVFRSSLLCLDFYFWELDKGIDIHNHNFYGYFKPVVGSIRHTRYDVESGSPIGPGVYDLTGLDERSSSMSATDPGVEIYPGESLVHDIAHLCTPTITLCVRTRSIDQQNYVYFPQWRAKLQLGPGAPGAVRGIDERALFSSRDDGFAPADVVAYLLYHRRNQPVSARCRALARRYVRQNPGISPRLRDILERCIDGESVQ